ncbi:MAG TPA: PQQ-binding-like beta-propeller repeat protein [Planctomycetaceae bacterium]|nr:PQQ-binding-like beta-propeller repeat protein [Planctomycetaceae bacterium]
MRSIWLFIGLLLLNIVTGCSSAKAQPDLAVDTGSPSSATRSSSVDKPGEEPAGRAKVTDAAASDLTSTRPGEDWPQFLGPRGTGVSGETGLLEVWPENGPPVLWERKLGEGYAPPSVMGERLVIMHRLKNREIVECLHAQTGETLWQYDYDTDFKDPYGFNGGTRCSPALTATRCYTLGPQGKLLCLNLVDGKKIWELDLDTKWRVPEHFFGFGCTPILYDDKLYVLVGGQPNSAVVAFDAETGKVLWEAGGKATWDGVPAPESRNRPYEWTGDETLVSYSTPIVADLHGKPHLLCLLRQGLASFDPNTGELNFKYWFRAKVHESVNAARPVVVGDEILITAAYEVGAALLKVKPDGKDYDVVWRKPRGMSCHWSTPIALDGYIYGFSGRHEQESQLQCVEWSTAELMWESNGLVRPLEELEQDPNTGKIKDKATGKEIPWPMYGRGSLLLADGKFIIQAERGPLALVKPDKEKLEEVTRVGYKQLGYPCWAAPVLSRGRLFLRSETHVIALDLLKPEA